MALTLTRELRLGLHESETLSGAATAALPNSVNGFAGNPGLWDVAPFLTLRATVAGEVDAATGMMVNIKQVDKVLREQAVPFLREAHYGTRRVGAAGMMVELLGRLKGRFLPHELTRLRLGLSPYLAYGIEHKEPGVVEMSLKFEFSAAHRLHSAGLSEPENAEVFGRCNNPNGHGHNYEIEVAVAGVPDEKTGMVMEVAQLQRVVNERIIDAFDHKHLNLDCADFAALNPTVENIAKVLYGRLKGGITGPAKLASMRVWETPKTMCEYRE